MLSSLINQRLGRSIVTALLGRGGMAAFYRAYHSLLQRDMALTIGMLIYRVCTEQRACTGIPQNVLLAYLQTQPPLPPTFQPDLSPSIDRGILKDRAKQRAARFATAGVYVSALGFM